MLEELQEKVKPLASEEWERCQSWCKQKRKRLNDELKNEIKHTIKVSTHTFEQLNKIKSGMPECTWDELFLLMLDKHQI